jgi:hypothetical protein
VRGKGPSPRGIPLSAKTSNPVVCTLGFDNPFAVSSSERSGGLGLFWNNNTRVEFLPYSQYHIDSIITEYGKEPWRLPCVSGEA